MADIKNALELLKLTDRKMEQEKESNYRRGYRDGMIVLHRDLHQIFMINKLTIKEKDQYLDFQHWLDGELQEWADEEYPKFELPPDFIRWRKNKE